MRTEEVKEATEARERLVATLKARVASTLKAIEEQGGTLPKAVLLRIFTRVKGKVRGNEAPAASTLAPGVGDDVVCRHLRQ